jgi:predicted PurR-regulated permease PerM
MTTSARPAGSSPSVSTLLLIAIFLILFTAALRFGAGLLLPIAIAGLFTLLLDPPVRALRRLGLPVGVGAALVVFGTLGALVGGGALLAKPASEWVEAAPRTMEQIQRKVRRLLRPIQRTAEQVDKAAESAVQESTPTVQLKAPGVLQRLTGSTVNFAATAITVVFLTYFLLAMLPVFRRKVAHLIGNRAGARSMEEVLTEIEVQMSRYVLINTLTSLGVGLTTWGFLAVVGLPNALLWGGVAFLLNFIPYAGALVTVVLVGMAGLVAFDSTGQVLLVMGGCVAINMIEGNLVTPNLLGKHLPLNPVAIFLSLLYWGWVWGPAGALLAVPITVMVQVLFSRIEVLRPVAILLDS